MQTFKEILARLAWGVLLIAAMFALIWFSLYQLDKQWAAEDAALANADTLATITAILQGDKKECRLLDNWPDAPLVMLEASRKYEIDPYLLPTISRVEGPTPAMLKACNVYGLEQRGKLIEFIDHYCATDAATAILAGYKYRYEIADGLVCIDTLAQIYCPVNAETWASNMKAIYERALCR